MTEDLYSILGVDPTADRSEIHDAYIDRIRMAHPDRATGDEELAKRINAAYHILSDPEQRRGYDTVRETFTCPVCGEASLDASLAMEHFAAHFATTRPGGCEMCGRIPAREFRFRSNSGFLFWRQRFEFQGALCRACSLGIFREFQTRNVTRGPWGIISFFASIADLIGNWSNHRTGSSGLGPPTPRDPTADSVFAGRPVFNRPAVYLSLGIITFLLVSMVNDSFTTSTPSQNTPTTAYSTSTTGHTTPTPSPTVQLPDYLFWTEGSCVEYIGNSASLTDCGTGADGRILQLVGDEYQCPAATEYVVTLDDGTIACLGP